MAEVWILGATGHSGGKVTRLLAAQGVPLTLLGRNEMRLREVAVRHGCPTANLVVADTVDRITAEIVRHKPAVVVNLLGDYAETGARIARACLPGGHYVDLAADLAGVGAVLDLHEDAAAAGSTVVTGAGFGVLATEAAVAKLCEGEPVPSHVRVDALASVAVEEARALGSALAASVVDAIASGARRYRDGRLVRARVGAEVRVHALPDGETAKSAVVPSGELLAARRVSGAANVVATSVLAPTSLVARAGLPVAGALLSVPAVRRFAVRRLAGVRVEPRPRPRVHSWGHAVVTWPGGVVREAWLRAGDGSSFTASAVVAVVSRLLGGGSVGGAFTPAAAFGTSVAEAAGGVFLVP